MDYSNLKVVKIERNIRSIFDRRKKVDFMVVSYYVRETEFREGMEFSRWTNEETMLHLIELKIKSNLHKLTFH